MPAHLASILVVNIPDSSAQIIAYLPYILMGGHTMGLYTMTKEVILLESWARRC